MIYLPPLQPVINSDICISGDVEIHPTASLAPGVILQAAPNSRITIGANVCVGMGVILNAGQGSITVESGVTLGSGVLIIGESKIGNNACIGTATTIFQASVAPMTVISPGSIIGDISRQIKTNEESRDTKTKKVDNSASNHNVQSTQNSTPSNNGQGATNRVKSATETNTVEANSSNTPSEEITESSVDLEATQEQDGVDLKPGSVVGKTYINQLLVTLFPHQKALDSNSPNTTPDSQ